jgi:hypothetical protein
MLKHDERRSKAIDHRLQEAANARKTADAEAKKFQENYQTLQQILPVAQQKFVSKWGNLTAQDWAASYQNDPQATAAAKIQYENDLAELQSLRAAQAQADSVAMQGYLREQHDELTRLSQTDRVVAKLTNPETGKKAKEELAKYLIGQGIPQEALARISAKEMSVAYKAYLYDQAQAARDSKKIQVSKPAQTPGMRNSATPSKSTSTNQLQQAQAKLASSGSAADAVAFLNLKEKARSKRK